MDAISVQKFLVEKPQRPRSRHIMEGKLQFLAKNEEINSNWMKGQDDSLLQIFDNFRENVFKIQMNQDHISTFCVIPCADIAALTYDDPWAFLSQIDLDKSLSIYLDGWREKMDIINVSNDQTDRLVSEIDTIDLILSGHIDEKFRRLRIKEKIFQRLSAYPNIASRIQFKKKCYFY